MKKVILIGVVFLLTVCFLTTGVESADIILKWDAPTENIDGTELTDLSGYNVYHDGIPEDVGNVLTHNISAVSEGVCFKVTAFDTSGNESDFSNEACVAIPPKAPSMGCTTIICNQCKVRCSK